MRRVAASARQLFAARRNQAPRGAACRGDAHLLAEDRAHGELEAVPAARDAQARSLRHERRESRIASEMRADRVDVGARVEDAPHAREDRGKSAHAREADANGEVALGRLVRDLDRAELAVGGCPGPARSRPRPCRARRRSRPFAGRRRRRPPRRLRSYALRGARASRSSRRAGGSGGGGSRPRSARIRPPGL